MRMAAGNVSKLVVGVSSSKLNLFEKEYKCLLFISSQLHLCGMEKQRPFEALKLEFNNALMMRIT